MPSNNYDEDLEFEEIDTNCSNCNNSYIEAKTGKTFCELRCRNVRPDENCSEFESKF